MSAQPFRVGVFSVVSFYGGVEVDQAGLMYNLPQCEKYSRLL